MGGEEWGPAKFPRSTPYIYMTIYLKKCQKEDDMLSSQDSKKHMRAWVGVHTHVSRSWERLKG